MHLIRETQKLSSHSMGREPETTSWCHPISAGNRPLLPFGGKTCDFGQNLIRPLRKCPSRCASCGLSANAQLSETKEKPVLLFHPCVTVILVQKCRVVNTFLRRQEHWKRTAKESSGGEKRHNSGCWGIYFSEKLQMGGMHHGCGRAGIGANTGASADTGGAEYAGVDRGNGYRKL